MELPETPATTAELRAMGITPKRLRLLAENGELRRLLRGVYVAGHVPDDIGLRVAATAKVVAPGHVVIDRTAAWLHGVDAFGFAETDTVVETAVPSDANPSDRADVDGHKRSLGEQDLTTLAGVEVTTPLRTALDLGCGLRRRDAFAAMCGLARAGEFDATACVAELPRFAGRRGVCQLRGLSRLVDPRMESHREAWVYLELADAGLPLPEPQVWVEIDGVPTYRLDFAYVGRRVAIEYDGQEFHGPDEEEHDAARRAALRALGWTVVVVRRGDFHGRNLDRWIRGVRDALRDGYSSRRW